MSAHPFLSPAWIEAARAIHARFADRVTPPEEVVRLNVTVLGAPFTDGEVLGHVDTTKGSIVPEEGHLVDPDLAIRVPYAVARRLLIDQRPDELMISFMSGEFEVEGDVTMIMALQDADPTPEQEALAEEVAAALAAITA